jgi:hypothetical protein
MDLGFLDLSLQATDYRSGKNDIADRAEPYD